MATFCFCKFSSHFLFILFILCVDILYLSLIIKSIRTL